MKKIESFNELYRLLFLLKRERGESIHWLINNKNLWQSFDDYSLEYKDGYFFYKKSYEAFN